MNIVRWLLGKTLASSEEGLQRVGPARGISLLGLDALSSAAYGPEAALTVLLPLGLVGLKFAFPIISAIVILAFVVYLSYRQTIRAYPNGGGSYTVAKQNLGRRFGLLAAVALLIDYILTVAVGISAGVGALISALPALQPHTLGLCLLILILITMANLRGIKESGTIFMLPTYAFVATLMGVIAYGLVKTVLADGHPIPVETLPAMVTAGESVTLWILLRAFASGCTAMTGVEAVSNGVKVFREPVVPNATKTLSIIMFVLIVMLLGISYLGEVYSIGATDPGSIGYESMVSQLLRAVVGRGVIYYITSFSVITALAFSANTGFADFPRLCQLLANDNFLPHVFSQRGRRLVFSYGIICLSLLSAGLLIFFGGVTDHLIPLYAIGAFLAFTLSQAGMVVHWARRAEGIAWTPLMVNLLGATATGITLVVIFISKFSEGAWITGLLIPIFLFIFIRVRKHYFNVAKEVISHEALDLSHRQTPLVIVPVKTWNKITRKALRFAMEMSESVYAVNILSDDQAHENLTHVWPEYVEEPSHAAGIPAPKLVTLPSPYRRLFGSLLDFIDDLEKQNPDRRIAIVIPNLAEFRWYHYFLHNQRAVLLRTVLFFRRDRRVVMVTVPWYLDE